MTNVEITWTNNDDSPDGGIDVERSANGGSWSTIASNLPPTTTSYTDTNTSGDATYDYRIERNTDHTTVTSGTTTIVKKTSNAGTTSLQGSVISSGASIIITAVGSKTSPQLDGIVASAKTSVHGNGWVNSANLFSSAPDSVTSSSDGSITDVGLNVLLSESTSEGIAGVVTGTLFGTFEADISTSSVGSGEVHSPMLDGLMSGTDTSVVAGSLVSMNISTGLKSEPFTELSVDSGITSSSFGVLQNGSVSEAFDSGELKSLETDILSSNVFTQAITDIKPSTPDVKINWTDNSDNEDGFKIYRKEGEESDSLSDYTEIATVDSNTTEYIDSLGNGRYTYLVEAFTEHTSSVSTGDEIEVQETSFTFFTGDPKDNVSIQTDTTSSVAPSTAVFRPFEARRILSDWAIGDGPKVIQSSSEEVRTFRELTLTLIVTKEDLKDKIRPEIDDAGKIDIVDNINGGFSVVSRGNGDIRLVAPTEHNDVRPIENYYIQEYEEGLLDKEGDKWEIELTVTPEKEKAYNNEYGTLDSEPSNAQTGSEWLFEFSHGDIATRRVTTDVTKTTEGSVEGADVNMILEPEQVRVLEESASKLGANTVVEVPDGADYAIDESTGTKNTVQITPPSAATETLKSGQYIITEWETTWLKSRAHSVNMTIKKT